ncbi:hypothetical protein FN846DRAFT_894766 [Sphaerosporella brunnea]|uniref:Uncharacterized protein n=1 Tax=Sphaerosporella brunnea TaxID=1250544 RepID=A0A5J5EI76_9PEZI|nr:hypothetical protein FN846DRAFT_894766 [Sphaerosporella brunnea]
MTATNQPATGSCGVTGRDSGLNGDGQDADGEDGRYSYLLRSTVAKRNTITTPMVLSKSTKENDESEDPDSDNAMGMADGGGIGHRLCSDRGSHDTWDYPCGYGCDSASNGDQVRFGSQTDCTADATTEWSYLRRTPATQQAIAQLKYEYLL